MYLLLCCCKINPSETAVTEDSDSSLSEGYSLSRGHPKSESQNEVIVCI